MITAIPHEYLFTLVEIARPGHTLEYQVHSLTRGFEKAKDFRPEWKIEDIAIWRE